MQSVLCAADIFCSKVRIRKVALKVAVPEARCRRAKVLQESQPTHLNGRAILTVFSIAVLAAAVKLSHAISGC